MLAKMLVFLCKIVMARNEETIIRTIPEIPTIPTMPVQFLVRFTKSSAVDSVMIITMDTGN